MKIVCLYGFKTVQMYDLLLIIVFYEQKNYPYVISNNSFNK